VGAATSFTRNHATGGIPVCGILCKSSIDGFSGDGGSE